MKTKKLSICLLLIFCTALSACQLPLNDKSLEEKAENQIIPISKNGLKLSIKNIDLKAKNIEITMKNNYSYEYNHGLSFRIDKKIKNKWYYVPFKDDAMVEDIGNTVLSNTEVTQTLPLDDLKNTLSPGEYRVVKFFTSSEYEYATNENGLVLAAQFKIEK